MKPASPFDARIAPARPEGRQDEGAGTHAGQGAPSARFPIEQTDIGLQYVIPDVSGARPPPQVQGGER